MCKLDGIHKFNKISVLHSGAGKRMWNTKCTVKFFGVNYIHEGRGLSKCGGWMRYSLISLQQQVVRQASLQTSSLLRQMRLIILRTPLNMKKAVIWLVTCAFSTAPEKTRETDSGFPGAQLVDLLCDTWQGILSCLPCGCQQGISEDA